MTCDNCGEKSVKAVMVTLAVQNPEGHTYDIEEVQVCKDCKIFWEE